MVARVPFALYVLLICDTIRCQDVSLIRFTGFSRFDLPSGYMCLADQIVIEIEGSVSRCAVECTRHSECMGIFHESTKCVGCQFFSTDFRQIEQTGSMLYWRKHDVYRVVTELMTYREAKANCKNLGGYLATVTSEKEHVFIAITIMEPAGVSGGAWTGATDRVTEGTFLWPDGTAFSLDLWHDGEPTGHAGDDCVASWGHYFGKCNDLPCSSEFASVCKFD